MKYDFIEIGTCNFDTLIERCSDEEYGLSIEPLEHFLNELPNKKNVTKINCAISSREGEITIYFVDNQTIKNFDLPWWFIGSSSIGKIHPGILRVLNERQLEASNIVNSKTIPTKKIRNIINEYKISSLDLLKIDTEGHDAIILQDFFHDFELQNIKFLPKTIIFEHNGLYPEEDYDTVLHAAKKLNYLITERYADTLLKLL